jgi:proteic killer suppression protein
MTLQKRCLPQRFPRARWPFQIRLTSETRATSRYTCNDEQRWDRNFRSIPLEYYPLTILSLRDIVSDMIKSFRCAETERLFRGQFSRKLPQDVHRRAAAKLNMIHAATRLVTLRLPPGNRLEALAGNREGQHSIRINEQWRICFVWRDGDAYDVEIVDYHNG